MKNLCLLLLLIPAAVLAQTTSNPLSAGSKAIFTVIKTNVAKAADQMPEENYSFKPTPEVRSFGQLIGHIADSERHFCAAASGDDTKVPSVEKSKTTKADLVQALNDALAYCDKVYTSMTDTTGSQMVQFFGHTSAKLTILDFGVAHMDEHYGNMVTYMRLKGLTPPSST